MIKASPSRHSHMSAGSGLSLKLRLPSQVILALWLKLTAQKTRTEYLRTLSFVGVENTEGPKIEMLRARYCGVHLGSQLLRQEDQWSSRVQGSLGKRGIQAGSWLLRDE